MPHAAGSVVSSLDLDEADVRVLRFLLALEDRRQQRGDARNTSTAHRHGDQRRRAAGAAVVAGSAMSLMSSPRVTVARRVRRRDGSARTVTASSRVVLPRDDVVHEVAVAAQAVLLQDSRVAAA